MSDGDGRGRLARTFTALGYRNYRLWTQQTALGFLVFDLTGSPAYLGLTTFASGVSVWPFMLYGGVIADRMPRRGLLLATQTTAGGLDLPGLRPVRAPVRPGAAPPGVGASGPPADAPLPASGGRSGRAGQSRRGLSLRPRGCYTESALEARITKLTEAENVYYTVYWSALRQPDRYDIIRSVPSMPGIYELYYLDDHKQLNLFFVAKAWYGGLRNSIRKVTDPELENDPRRRRTLQERAVYYRYVIVQSFGDMADIMYFFAATYFPHGHRLEPSGRYENIFVNEISPEKIVTV